MTIPTPPAPPAADVSRPWLRPVIGLAAVLAALGGAAGYFLAFPDRAPAGLDRWIEDVSGGNPHPVHLLRPANRPLSALALVGEQLFHDPALSASGRQSCASCHSPDHAFAPGDGRDVQQGGPDMQQQGLRPPPSLAYLYRQAAFGIGPAGGEEDVVVPLDQLALKAQATPHATKSAASAGSAAASAALVPSGGLFWDGREDMLMDQAMGPMMNPAEMANTNKQAVIARLLTRPYIRQLLPLFGAHILDNPDMLFIEAMSAMSAYQVESRAFHRFDSKYDHWLEGNARLSHAEVRGLRLFNDPAKGNCAACHLSQPGRDGMPPLFTDTEYEALGVPRNPRLAANRDPAYFDLGVCGPLRRDMARQTQYCGMFLTPTLRNSADRKVYFHNGVYHTLKQVLDFYNLRSVAPEKIYPRDAQGHVQIYNDIPAAYHGNVDVTDAPFTLKRGDKPPLSDGDIADIIAFLHTLDDGYGEAAGPAVASSGSAVSGK